MKDQRESKVRQAWASMGRRLMKAAAKGRAKAASRVSVDSELRVEGAAVIWNAGAGLKSVVEVVEEMEEV